MPESIVARSWRQSVCGLRLFCMGNGVEFPDWLWRVGAEEIDRLWLLMVVLGGVLVGVALSYLQLSLWIWQTNIVVRVCDH